MGYDLFITRANDHLQTADHPISEEEWQRVAQSDPSLSLSTEDYYDRRGKDGTVERFHPFLWITHPDSPPFMLIDGAIEIKSPDEATILKLVDLAGKLGAHVLDEEDGRYSVGGDGGVAYQPAG